MLPSYPLQDQCLADHADIHVNNERLVRCAEQHCPPLDALCDKRVSHARVRDNGPENHKGAAQRRHRSIGRDCLAPSMQFDLPPRT